MDDVWTPLLHKPKNISCHGRTIKLPEKLPRPADARHGDIDFVFVALSRIIQDQALCASDNESRDDVQNASLHGNLRHTFLGQTSIMWIRCDLRVKNDHRKSSVPASSLVPEGVRQDF
jgi:hypothetical protein